MHRTLRVNWLRTEVLLNDMVSTLRLTFQDFISVVSTSKLPKYQEDGKKSAGS